MIPFFLNFGFVDFLFALTGKTKCWYDEGGPVSVPSYRPGLSDDDVFTSSWVIALGGAAAAGEEPL